MQKKKFIKISVRYKSLDKTRIKTDLGAMTTVKKLSSMNG